MNPEATGFALLVEVSGDRYALRLEGVTEVLRPVWVSSVPDTDGYFVGVVDVRGSIVPVFDLRVRLGSGGGGFTPGVRFVGVIVGGRPALLVVDGAHELIALAGLPRQSAAELFAGPVPPVLQSVVSIAGQGVPLLDIGHLTSPYDLTKLPARRHA